MRGRTCAKAILALVALTAAKWTFLAPRQLPRRELLGALLVAAPLPAQAGITRWSGIYNDPKHPGCERAITKDRDEFVISGTSSKDGSKACAEDAPTKKWYLTATPGESPDELIIDFSPKGGPKDAVAKLDGDGIVFPDGNRWSKIKRKPGEAAASYLDGPTSPLNKWAKGKVPT